MSSSDHASCLRPRSALFADRSRFHAMRGEEALAFGRLRPAAAFGLVGRAKSALAQRLDVGRRTSVTRYLVVDLAVLGGNALLASVAASRAVRSGLTALLACEPSLGDVPEGLVEDPAFRALVDRLLGVPGDPSCVAPEAPFVPEAPFEAAIRTLSTRGAGGRIVRYGPDVQVTVRAAGPREAMLLASPRQGPCPSAAAGVRMLSTVCPANAGRPVAQGTLTAVFARRVVVCGAGRGVWSQAVPDAPTGGPVTTYGSARRVPHTAAQAAHDLMADLAALSEGRHLLGLSPEP